jgi:hypothetical protein
MRFALALFGATACWIASGCGAPSSTILPICAPGGEQALVAPSPGSSSVPTSSLSVYIASSVPLVSNNYRFALSTGNGKFVYGDPARPFGPVPSPTPTATVSLPPTPFPGAIYYETLGFTLTAGQYYTVYITGNGCLTVPIAGASFSTASQLRGP